MKPLAILVLDFANDELAAKLCAVLEGLKSVSYEILKPKNPKSAEKIWREKMAGGDFDALLFTITGESAASAEKLLASKAFDDLRKPTLLCIEHPNPDKLLNFFSLGIDDFVVAPVKADDLLLRLRRLTQKDYRREKLLARSKEKMGLRRIIGQNPAFLAEINKLPVIARCDVCVLITGETGTGKEIVARAIHYLSPRAAKPFVPINCGAIPNDLVENELFGHERGAFTGALETRRGLIREADGGTLFLDEIDSLPLISQVKLLRFLQDKEYRSLGSAKTQTADVRIVAASNHNLEELVRDEKIRLDLYYRLNVMQVALPPLRDRAEDIALLAHHFLDKYALEFRKEILSIEPKALTKLQEYNWRGNVRELENVIERAVLFCESGTLTASLLTFGESKVELVEESFRAAKARAVSRFERSYLKKILETHHGNISQAARAAGKNRRAFFELLRKHRIDVDHFKS